MKVFSRLFTVFIFWLSGLSPAFAGETGFQVIVNPANSVTTIDQKFLAEIFLKKKVFWSDMRAIMVADLDPSSDVRREFSEKVLERPVSAVRNYWQQLLFSGRAIPPPEFKNDEEVLNFIASHEEAIGYVSSQADLRNLKAVTIK